MTRKPDDTFSAAPPREHAKYWHDPHAGGLELLRATFVTHAFPRHTHEEQYVVGAVESGVQACITRGVQNYYSEGTLILLNPGTVHGGAAFDSHGYRYRAFYPNLALMQEVAAKLLPSAASVSGGLPYFLAPYSFHDPQMARRLIALHAAVETGLPRLEQDSRLLLLLAELFRRYGEQQPLPLGGSQPRAVHRAREYLRANASRNVSLETLSTIADLSPFHLLRVFRQEVGVTPHAYQTQQRVRIAHRLLLAGTGAAEAAIEAGFVDQSHLTRHFKRLTGVAPGAFQKASGIPPIGERHRRNFVQEPDADPR